MLVQRFELKLKDRQDRKIDKSFYNVLCLCVYRYIFLYYYSLAYVCHSNRIALYRVHSGLHGVPTLKSVHPEVSSRYTVTITGIGDFFLDFGSRQHLTISSACHILPGYAVNFPR